MKINNLDTIKQLIAENENTHIEFKESTGQLERGLETLCAFLNGDGGTVLFGVSDNGNIIGQEVSDKTKRNIAEAVTRLEPNTNIDISYIPTTCNGKSVIALSVDTGNTSRPYCYKGRPYMRVESITTTMPQSKYNELLIQREEYFHSWETLPNPHLKIEDLDKEEVYKTIRLGVEAGRLPETTGNDIYEILEKFELIEDGILKNAAAVLFAKKKISLYPQNMLKLARFKGLDKTSFIDNQRIRGNIFQLLDAAMSFLFKHLSLSGTIESLERTEQLEIPYKAIREAIINSLCHRSYRDISGSVAIAIYDDRVEIENPGTFPSGWDINKIKSSHSSKPHNPIIADILYLRKILESWGRGINLMIEECLNAGLPEPEFINSFNEVKVVFRRKYTGQVTGQATGQVTGQVTAMLKYLLEKPLSVRELMALLSLKGRDNFLKSYLNPALHLKLIEQTHPERANHPHQKYCLTAKGEQYLQSLNTTSE